jgi:hypothetical protein
MNHLVVAPAMTAAVTTEVHTAPMSPLDYKSTFRSARIAKRCL